jgi:hypothetical protein
MAYSRIKTLIPVPLAVLLAVAVILRLIGIGYGFPLFLVNDEPAIVLGALKMIEFKTLVPAFHEEEFRKVLYYPPFASYVYLAALFPVLLVHYALLGFPGPVAYADHLAIDPGVVWIAARVITILFSLIVIALAYHLARRVTSSDRAAFFGAAFLSFSYFHLQVSQVVRHWMLASVFLSFAWLAALRIRESDSWKGYSAAGMLTGLAIGVNTSAAIALLPAIIAHFAKRGQTLARSIISTRLLTMVAFAIGIAAVATLLYPYGLTRGEGASSVSGDFGRRFASLQTKNIGEWASFLMDYARLLVRYEVTIVATAIIGAIALWRKNLFFVGTLLVVVVTYITALYLFFNGIPRALVFLLPGLAVLAGYGADYSMKWLENHSPAHPASILGVPLVVGVVFFAYPIVFDLRYDYLLSRDDTRLVAIQWIREHIPAGSKILMDSQYLRLPNTEEGIRWLEHIDATSLRSQDRALLRTPSEQYPAPSFFVLNLSLLKQSKIERKEHDSRYFRSQGFRYLVVEYERTNMSDVDPATRDLLGKLPLLERITPFKPGVILPVTVDASGEITSIGFRDFFKFDRFGEIVDIYDLTRQEPVVVRASD